MALFPNTSSPDSLLGTVAADFLSIAAGDLVGAGADTFHGFEGNDTAEGGLENDRLFGGLDDDFLFAGTGDDTLFGGSGNDFLWITFGQTGSAFGGTGFDVLSFEFATAGASVDLKNGLTTGFLLGSIEGLFGTAFDDVMTGGGAAESFVGSTGNDNAFGGGGNDTLDGGRFDDLLTGGAGDDQLFGGSGLDRMFGGTGTDFIVIDLFGQTVDADLARGGAGDDAIETNGGNDTLNGDAGTDILKLNSSADLRVDLGPARYVVRIAPGEKVIIGGFESLFTSSGDDTLKGNIANNLLQSDAGNDRLFGLDGSDTLNGGDGHDTLLGGTASDLLVGGDGTDQMSGNGGADRFEFNTGPNSPLASPDVITDFTSGVDKIVLSAFFDFTVFRQCHFSFIGSAAFSGVADEVRFSGGVLQGDSNLDGVADFAISLIGVAALAAGDFVF